MHLPLIITIIITISSSSNINKATTTTTIIIKFLFATAQSIYTTNSGYELCHAAEYILHLHRCALYYTSTCN